MLYWPAAVLLMTWAQGKLLPAIRRTPPGREAQLQALALHYVLGVGYLLPLALAPTVLGLEVALASRRLLFDPVLNTSAGEPAFAIGATALTDRALRWLAARLSWKPETLRLVVWVVSLLLTTLGAIHFSGKLSTFILAGREKTRRVMYC
jgi:hypothetical protein